MPIRAELRHFYTTDRWKAARAACRDRAGDRCEQCGRANGSTYEKDLGTEIKTIEVQCGAAHLNNVAGDDRPENLAWLCRACHLHHDVPFHRYTRATRKDRARPLIVKATEPYQTTIDEQLKPLAAMKTAFKKVFGRSI